jgi:plastocyanin
MSSHIQSTPEKNIKMTLKRRLLGLGAVGGILTAGATVIAMSTAVGGVALLSNAASTTAAAPAANARAAGAVAAPAATHKSVMIQNYAFAPAALTVKVGDTVTWTNMDTAPHTVTVSSGPVTFASQSLQTGQTFSYTFTRAGTYQYYCAVHPDMKASVTVVGSSGGGTTTPTPVPITGMGGPGGMPTATTCGGAISALNALMQHLYAGHLEASPGQQVSDILNTDQYVKTHTVLVENMIKPLLGGGEAALNTFMQHLYAGHLEASPGQQVSDILNTDQYVKTHTVLVENMIKPLLGGDGTC